MMTLQFPTCTKPKQRICWGYWQGLENEQQFQAQTQEPDPFDSSDSHQASHFHPTVQTQLPRPKDLFWDDTDKVNYVLSFLKGTGLDCFESAVLDPVEPPLAFGFRSFLEELEPNFRTYYPVVKQKPNLKTLHPQKPPGYEVLLSSSSS